MYDKRDIKCMIKEILNVCTKEYKEETEYRQYMEDHIDDFKLKSNGYDADERVELLKQMQNQG